ncbi:MAG: toll/interleukin-1 receptor domain-containing protein [Pseudomonadota bacterium]
MTDRWEIPNKTPALLRRLEILYRKDEDRLLHEIIHNAAIYVDVEVTYDNWNGGTAGHALTFFLNEETLQQLGDLDTQHKIEDRLKDDLNKCIANNENEHIDAIYIELFDENDARCRLGQRPFGRIIINPETVTIWKPGHIRLFLSHRDYYKQQASELALALEEYGISTFVAHDTIEPMEKWQHVIEQGLKTMEVMAAFITDDFFESVWTNQEIGFALAQPIPIIPIKLQKCDPQGFISHVQAVPSDLEYPAGCKERLYNALKKLGFESRLRHASLEAFINSPSYSDTVSLFDKLHSIETLTTTEENKIINAYRSNSNLYNSIYLNNQNERIRRFLESRTGKKFKIENYQIKELKSELDDIINF